MKLFGSVCLQDGASKLKVFLSHSTRDKEFVQRLATALEDADFKPWLCEVDIDRGQNFVTKINDGLGQSDLAILVWSPHAAESAWTEQEWTSALARQVEEHRIGLGINLLLFIIDPSRVK